MWRGPVAHKAGFKSSQTVAVELLDLIGTPCDVPYPDLIDGPPVLVPGADTLTAKVKRNGCLNEVAPGTVLGIQGTVHVEFDDGSVIAGSHVIGTVGQELPLPVECAGIDTQLQGTILIRIIQHKFVTATAIGIL